MHEEDTTFTNQRSDNDPVHSLIRARTSDRNGRHAAIRAPVEVRSYR